ncbi:Competence protein CoiA-like family, contains a predicted nuclease domain [Lentibacillus persicus]|uniref:Competence protein CoiA-like family, contains a predicted nuclease domain n=1 Tax=Lentibacillus persicus TaxID=640948 RepID=A0A1I1RWR9_9BACI|nr:competence protein CoiA family protein [Lentibacillus persicus]SFD38814.1 Competence protein CoiA-like family, contains a predicted nuclease domain [Lentibacillus persicus]
MLQAKTEYGKRVVLALFTKREIKALKQHTRFFCPACNEPVVAKAGSKITPHFAHNARSNCPARDGGEGPYHEKGKLLLYNWLKHQQLNVSLEEYLPQSGQRPDVLIRLQTKTIAVEYQCARITPDEIIERTRGYEKAGIIPIWILGANQFKRCNQNEIKVDTFLLHFIHQFSADFPLTLYFFCPDTLSFITFQDLYLSTQRQGIGNVTIKKLNTINFTNLFNKTFLSQKELLQNWLIKKRLMRTRPSRRAFGQELVWQQWLYINALNRDSLPAPIYLPVTGQYRMKTHPWDWQSRLCIEVIDRMRPHEPFSVKRCMHLLRPHIRPSHSFPLIKSSLNPVYQYLKLLEELQVVQEISPHQFIKKESFVFYEHIEDALDGDNMLIAELMKQNTGMFPG